MLLLCCVVVVVIVVSFKYLLVREPKVPAISLDHIYMEKFIESTHSALDRTGMIVQEWTQKYPTIYLKYNLPLHA